MGQLKVFGLGLMHDRHIRRHIVAAHSQREAAKIFGCSAHHVRTYGSVTGNAREMELALLLPGTVFIQIDHHGTYIKRKDIVT